MLEGHGGPVWTLALSANGKMLYSGSYDGTIRSCNVESGEVRRLLCHQMSRPVRFALHEKHTRSRAFALRASIRARLCTGFASDGGPPQPCDGTGTVGEWQYVVLGQ